MGLDMYLYAKKQKYASTYQRPEQCVYPDVLKELEERIEKDNYKSCYFIELYQIAYWRKFNALHNWIVENKANGIDECQEIELGQEDIKALVDIFNEILKDHSKAKELLPTCDGFFFGTQEYDEWYFNDMQYSVDIFKKILQAMKKDEKLSLIYQASW